MPNLNSSVMDTSLDWKSLVGTSHKIENRLRPECLTFLCIYFRFCFTNTNYALLQ